MDGRSCASIKSIPPEIAARIKSATTISTVSDVVLGLFANSLEANAANIHINVDFTRRSCTLEDDGHGIQPDSFQHGLARRYHTSKLDSSGDWPFRHSGTFLASVASVSLLSIVSKHTEHISANSLLVSRGNHLPQHKGAEVRPLKHHGTVVTVRDILGAVPVRVKQLSQSNPAKEWSLLLHRVAAMLLAWSTASIVTLESQQFSGKRIRFCSPGLAPQTHTLHRTGTSRSNKSHIDRLRSVLLVLMPDGSARSLDLTAVSATTSSYSAKGIFSTTPHHNKRLQFISIADRPMQATEDAKALFDAVNTAFDRSYFGHDTETGASNAFSDRDLQQRGKATDRWPIFSVRITSPRQMRSHNVGQDIPYNTICKILSALADGWLQSHGFNARKIPKSDTVSTAFEQSQSLSLSTQERPSSGSCALPPTKRPKTMQTHADTIDAFGDWSRVKGGCAALKRSIWSAPSQSRCAKSDMTVSVGLAIPTSGGDKMLWHDNNTGQDLLVSPYTGMALLAPNSTKVTCREGESWLAGALQGWHNPVFASVQDHSTCGHGRDNAATSLTAAKESFPQLSDYSGTVNLQLSRISLLDATVIGQVDDKYILVRLPMNESSALVMLDQHAVSERVILESLFADLFAPCAERVTSEVCGRPAAIATQALTRPILFSMTRSELELLHAKAAVFAEWGIIFTLSADKLTITHLPAAISQRCVREPKVLIELIREELHTARPTKTERSTVSSGSSNTDWTSRLAHCPPRFVALLQSRACRSAVMFNDKLSQKQCESMIRQLAATAMPFCCAHGRVSAVPLLVLPGNAGPAKAANGAKACSDERGDFVSAYRQWQSPHDNEQS